MKTVSSLADLRQSLVRESITQEAARLHRHPENDPIDNWIELVAELDD